MKVRPRTIDAETIPAHFHSGQAEIWNAPEQELGAIAGTQGGKTDIEAPWLLREIQRTTALAKELKRGTHLYVGPTLELLKVQAIPAFKLLFEEELRLGRFIDGNKPKFVFSGDGATALTGENLRLSVQFAYARNSSNLESLTALSCVSDESGQEDYKEASYDAVNRRLLVARKRGYGRHLMATTPYNQLWFKRRVYDRWKAGDKTIRCANWPSWFNPMVDEADCRLELERGMAPWEWEMKYLGLFTKPAGAIYDCFSETENVCDDFDIPEDWPRIYGIDFGHQNTAAVALAEGPDETLYVYSTYHQPSQTDEVHIMRIKEKFGGDPQSCFGGSSSENNKRYDFSRCGLHVAPPSPTGPDSVEAQIRRVYAQFATRKLKVFRSLVNLIDDITSYSRVIDGQGQVTMTIANRSRYHRLDALRYSVGTLRPQGNFVARVHDRIKPQGEKQYGFDPVPDDFEGH